MLLARYAPVGSQRYEKLTGKVKVFDKIIEWLPAQLFAIWSIFVAGMAAGKAQIDRYYFWDWSDWLIGIVGILVITILYKLIREKFSKVIYKYENLTFKTIGNYLFISLILLYIGVLLVNEKNLTYTIIYTLPIFAICIIHLINIEKNNSLIQTDSNKHVKTVSSSLLLVIAIILGVLFDDPVITTASIVSLPFFLVLLFGKHVRHLERAKFYPIFIFAMFVTSREAWFLIPLLVLFFILRSYNYLRYQKVYPTFGVTGDDTNN